MGKAEIRILTREEYPAQLREIPHVPPKLWIQGTLPLVKIDNVETRILAVVGSRALSTYGREVCQMLIRDLAGYPISIVSGLAIGADTCAHRAALDAGLHTIAIPGSGLGEKVLYPRQNLKLAQEILYKGGALLSEHEPGYRARDFDFPSRNRIMAGLAHAALIIEAGPDSGTLITARMALDYNREVLCVPHRITDPHSFAANKYISEGAKYVSSSLDILEALMIRPLEDKPGIKGDEATGNRSTAHAKGAELQGEAKKIYKLLEIARSRDSLIRLCKLPAQQVIVHLISLEIQGLATEEDGEWKQIV